MIASPKLATRDIDSVVLTPKRKPISEYIEWDVRNWSTTLNYWLSESSQDLSNASALEIGSRHGGLSLWMASQGASVVCSDLNGPTEKAILQHRAHRVADRIEYRALDATQLPYQEEFDLVVFKSVLGGIGSRGGKEAQLKAIKEMHKALKEGGELFFAENLIGSPVHQFFRNRFVSWAAEWRYVTIVEMEEFLSLFSQVRFCTMGFAGAFGRSETQRSLLGLVDKAILDHMIPNRWNYIICGVATK
jgi:SAM-dependent methyltransferase